MSILVALHHVTRYRYDRRVGIGPRVLRLRPAPHCRTRVARPLLGIAPAGHCTPPREEPAGEFPLTLDLRRPLGG